MKFRAWVWSTGIAVGAACFLASYLVIISRQGNRPVAWFVTALVIGGGLPTIGLVTPSLRTTCLAVSAAVLTALAMLTGFSIGPFLIPVALIAWTAFATEPLHSVRDRGNHRG